MENTVIYTRRDAELSEEARRVYDFYAKRADENGLAWIDVNSWNTDEQEELLEKHFMFIIGEGRYYVVRNAYLLDVFNLLTEEELGE